MSGLTKPIAEECNEASPTALPIGARNKNHNTPKIQRNYTKGAPTQTKPSRRTYLLILIN
jgi:hypothetical protein